MVRPETAGWLKVSQLKLRRGCVCAGCQVAVAGHQTLPQNTETSDKNISRIVKPKKKLCVGLETPRSLLIPCLLGQRAQIKTKSNE